MNRRTFLKKSAAASLVVAGAKLLPARVWAGEAPAILPVKNPNSKLQLAVVGLGGISGGHTLGIARDEHLVALCECDPWRYNARFEQIKKYEVHNVKPEDMKLFRDYREMLEKMAGKLDGVVVCTPDHNHAIIALDCMKRGIHAFVEKPMSHNIHEAYALRDAARKYGVAAAMGNEGHTGEGARVAIERLLAGQLGAVTEVYFWLVGRYSGQGGCEVGLVSRPRPTVDDSFRLWSVPVHPEEANVEYRYEPGIEKDPLAKQAWGWHGERRWGSGSLGDWAPHLMDVAYSGLAFGQAPSWNIECVERLFGGERLYYKKEVYRWRIPSRGSMPPVEAYWHSGVQPDPNAELVNENGEKIKAVYNFPAKALEIQKRYDYKLPTEGALLVAEKGSVFFSQYGFGACFPRELSKSWVTPPQVLPRVAVPKGVDTNRGEWYNAIRTGVPATTNFDYAAPFTEFYQSGNLASRAPMGTVIKYDVANHRVTSHPELNQYLTRKYREGYEV